MTKKMIRLFLGFMLICVPPVFADQSTVIMTAADNCTREIYIPRGDRLNVKITPNSNSDLTVWAENKFPEESSWAYVEDWVMTGISKAEVNTTARPEQEDVWYRLRCNSYTSGNVTARIGH